jgi:hypothetical protein
MLVPEVMALCRFMRHASALACIDSDGAGLLQTAEDIVTSRKVGAMEWM